MGYMLQQQWRAMQLGLKWGELHNMPQTKHTTTFHRIGEPQQFTSCLKDGKQQHAIQKGKL
jgi:hypothetical protein